MDKMEAKTPENKSMVKKYKENFEDKNKHLNIQDESE
jgi:hypothetical protein